ncbi:hypothetical protein AB0L44_02915 [Nonomuraea wenchangensis]|uniref:hypothetical protein n=1 Tax=Nonomuraea wenchangensis TaxID=568860 RepID=UPI003444CFB7
MAARARRLSAAGAVTAFVVAGVSLTAGYGSAASASASASADSTAVTRTDPQVPGTASDCVLPLPLRCDAPADSSWTGGDPRPSGADDSWSGRGDSWSPVPSDTRSDAPAPGDTWSNAPVPGDTWSEGPAPQDSWSSAPTPQASDAPWRPAREREHRVPRGHPETGGGGLVQDGPVWALAVGGFALVAGAGLTGVAVRRRRDAD